MDTPTTQVTEHVKNSTNVMKVLTWNTEGGHDHNLPTRTEAITKIISSEQADIVCLQEVNPEMKTYFLEHLQNEYNCLYGADAKQRNTIFLKKSTVEYTSHIIIPYVTSTKGNIMQINATFGNVPLILMTTHLSRKWRNRIKRKLQLRKLVREILNAPRNQTVIFGGDLNLRDGELKDLGGLPPSIEDVWVKCGSRIEDKYTWDLTKNDNMAFPEGNTPHFRFDRVFFRDISPPLLKPVSFGLIGLERVAPGQCFPSDHFSIKCHFEVL